MSLAYRFRLLATVFTLLLLPAKGRTQLNVLGTTPPMGWNSWNHFGKNVTDADVRTAADALVKSGLRDAGYVYVNVDDGWEGKRDADGVIHTNDKFPDMKALGDYLHSKGLKFGIYSSPGPKTCAGFEGSYGHEESDAKTYASWGVDFLKYDLCSYQEIMLREARNDPQKQTEMMKAAYAKMHLALMASGRPIFYSLCQYGWGNVWLWGAEVGGNSWRTTLDIHDTYSSMTGLGFSEVGLGVYAGPAHWNDPDMLEVGNGGMSSEEYRMHMSLWALLGAPLLMGNDLSHMDAKTLQILGNREVIAVDQDSQTAQGDRIWAHGAQEIWKKPLHGNTTAVGLFNRGEKEVEIRLPFAELGLHDTARAYDLWAHKDLGLVKDGTALKVPRHGVILLRLTHS